MKLSYCPNFYTKFFEKNKFLVHGIREDASKFFLNYFLPTKHFKRPSPKSWEELKDV